MIAITIAATTLAAVSGLTARTALLRRRDTAPTVTAVEAPDIAALARGRHRRAAVGDAHPDAEAVRRARARAATVAAVAAIPVPRRTPEHEGVMPALPVAPFIPAPRHRR